MELKYVPNSKQNSLLVAQLNSSSMFADGSKPYQSLFTKYKRQQNILGLQPILEDKDAQVIQPKTIVLPKVSQSQGRQASKRSAMTILSDPDNGILFLEDGERLRNPRNMPTPPPPMWGEVLEEDLYDTSQPFYDHARARSEYQKRVSKIGKIKLTDNQLHSAIGASQDS